MKRKTKASSTSSGDTSLSSLILRRDSKSTSFQSGDWGLADDHAALLEKQQKIFKDSQYFSPWETRVVTLNAKDKESYARFSNNNLVTHNFQRRKILRALLLPQNRKIPLIWLFFLIFTTFGKFVWNLTIPWWEFLLNVSFYFVVVLIKIGREVIIKRQMDNNINKNTCHIFNQNTCTFFKAKWQDIRVGNIVRIFEGEMVPADVILLNCGRTKQSYFDTSKLDGKIRLKRKYPVEDTQTSLSLEALRGIHGRIMCKAPYFASNKFEGSFKLDTRPRSSVLGQSNFVLNGSFLRNTPQVDAVAVYTIGDRNNGVNDSKEVYKTSVVERSLHEYFVVVSIVLALLIILSSILSWTSFSKTTNYSWNADNEELLRTIVSFCAQYQNFLPLILFAVVDILRISLARKIQRDPLMTCRRMNGARSTTSVCNSDLLDNIGQVDFLLTDKTGTITQKKKQFECCSVNDVLYECKETGVGGSSELEPFLESGSSEFPNAKKTKPGSADAAPKGNDERQKSIDETGSGSMKAAEEEEKLQAHPIHDLKKVLEQKGDEGEVANHFLLAMAVCNSVETEYPLSPYSLNLRATSSQLGTSLSADESDLMIHNLHPDAKVLYKGQYPDEICLVKQASALGYKLLFRSSYKIVIAKNGVLREFEIIGVNNFTSRGCMSILVRDELDGNYILYCKGSSKSLVSRLKDLTDEKFHNFKQQMNEIAERGLRSFVMAYKHLSPRAIQNAMKIYGEKSFRVFDKKEFIEKVADVFEKKLTMLGVCGLSNTLQNGVVETFEVFAEAGIRIWMLSGDTSDSTVATAYNAGLLKRSMKVIRMQFYMMRRRKADYLQHLSKKVKAARATQRVAIVLKGDDVAELLLEAYKYLFADIACASDVIVGSELSEDHKEALVELLRNTVTPEPTVLAVGDGVNDAKMLKAAHVGIYVMREKDYQHLGDADFVIPRFRMLQRLLLVYGHLGYLRISDSILWLIFKDALLVLPTVFFNFYSNWSASPIYTWLTKCSFTFLWSVFPIISYGNTEADAPKSQLVNLPLLYILGRRHTYFNAYYIAIWLLEAVLLSLAIFLTVTLSMEESSQSLTMKSLDLAGYGIILLINVTICSNIILLLESNRWTTTLLLSCLIFSSLFMLLFFLVGPMFLSELDARLQSIHIYEWTPLWITTTLNAMTSILLHFGIKKAFKRCFPDIARRIGASYNDLKDSHLSESQIGVTLRSIWNPLQQKNLYLELPFYRRFRTKDLTESQKWFSKGTVPSIELQRHALGSKKHLKHQRSRDVGSSDTIRMSSITSSASLIGKDVESLVDNPIKSQDMFTPMSMHSLSLKLNDTQLEAEYQRYRKHENRRIVTAYRILLIVLLIEAIFLAVIDVLVFETTYTDVILLHNLPILLTFFILIASFSKYLFIQHFSLVVGVLGVFFILATATVGFIQRIDPVEILMAYPLLFFVILRVSFLHAAFQCIICFTAYFLQHLLLYFTQPAICRAMCFERIPNVAEDGPACACLLVTLTLLPSLLGILALTAYVGYRMEYNERITFLLNYQLEISSIRQTEILNALLPSFVVKEMLKSPVEAENASMMITAEDCGVVSVIFCDLYEFQTLVSSIDPTEIVKLLDSVFLTFDRCAENFGCIKIETVSDTYLCAAGLKYGKRKGSTVGDSAINAVEMAACMLMTSVLIPLPSEKNETDKDGLASISRIRIKIGINTGRVISGVVGAKKPQFVLFGDTVNTASRMKDVGEVDRVHISSETYQHIIDDHRFQWTHKKTEVKGKGLMDTYLLQKVVDYDSLQAFADSIQLQTSGNLTVPISPFVLEIFEMDVSRSHGSFFQNERRLHPDINFKDAMKPDINKRSSFKKLSELYNIPQKKNETSASAQDSPRRPGDDENESVPAENFETAEVSQLFESTGNHGASVFDRTVKEIKSRVFSLGRRGSSQRVEEKTNSRDSIGASSTAASTKSSSFANWLAYAKSFFIFGRKKAHAHGAMHWFFLTFYEDEIEQSYKHNFYTNKSHINTIERGLLIFFSAFIGQAVTLLSIDKILPFGLHLETTYLLIWLFTSVFTGITFFLWLIMFYRDVSIISSKLQIRWLIFTINVVFAVGAVAFTLLHTWGYTRTNMFAYWSTVDTMVLYLFITFLHHNSGLVFNYVIYINLLLLATSEALHYIVTRWTKTQQLAQILIPIFLLLNLIAAYLKEYVDRCAFILSIGAQETEAKRRELLSDMLPKRVLEEYQNDRLRLAYKHEKMSFLFADICGFTAWSMSVAAEEVVLLLQLLFSKFDRETTRLEIYKLCTIGDAYICVSEPTTSDKPGKDPIIGAEKVLHMARKMLGNIDIVRKNLKLPSLNMRIGLHYGACVGGLVGSGRLRYDMWGRDVLTGHMIESNGMAGRICCSEAYKTFMESHQRSPNLTYTFIKTIDVTGDSVKMFAIHERGEPETKLFSADNRRISTVKDDLTRRSTRRVNT